MRARAKDYPVFEQTRTLNVAAPEDVIGLKVQALANDPDRRLQDLADIESLCALYADRLDWERSDEFFGLFDLKEDARKLREKFARAH